MDTQVVSVDLKGKAMAELHAMQAVVEALADLDAASTSRVLRWAAEQYRTTPISTARPADSSLGGAENTDNGIESPLEYETVADLVAAANPRNGPERAMVVAYWLHMVEKSSEFEAKALNYELKHMGHALANVTATLTSLISQRPQLVIQTHKSGRGTQGRKRYKLTSEGIRRVKEMLRQVPAEDEGASER